MSLGPRVGFASGSPRYLGGEEVSVALQDGVDAHETLLSIDKARRVLGYEPQHGWRDVTG